MNLRRNQTFRPDRRQTLPLHDGADPHARNVDPAEIAGGITPKTKAVFMVQCADLICVRGGIMKPARRPDSQAFENCTHARGSVCQGSPAIGDAVC